MFDFEVFKKLNDTFVNKTREGFEVIYKEEYNEYYQARKEDAILFVERIIDLYLKNPSQVYFTFPFYDPNPMVFLDSLLSFYGNYFFDDSYFSIEFYNSRLNRNKEMKYYLGNSWTDFSSPKIVDNENGTQDPKELLKLLDWMEEQKEKAKERFEAVQKILRGNK